MEKNKIEKVKEEFEKEPNSVEMHINRIPTHAHSSFKELANELFAGDYGMTLTYLIWREDLRSEFYQEYSRLEARIDELEKELSNMKDFVSNKLGNKDEEDKGSINTIG